MAALNNSDYLKRWLRTRGGWCTVDGPPRGWWKKTKSRGRESIALMWWSAVVERKWSCGFATSRNRWSRMMTRRLGVSIVVITGFLYNSNNNCGYWRVGQYVAGATVSPTVTIGGAVPVTDCWTLRIAEVKGQVLWNVVIYIVFTTNKNTTVQGKNNNSVNHRTKQVCLANIII